MLNKVIMDCDPGIDDSLAILLAGKSLDIELTALTIVSGNIEVNQASRNAMKALDMAGNHTVPVYKGASLPLKKEYIDATDTHGADGIGENFFEVTDRCEKEDAIDFMIRKLHEEPMVHTILALGPLTNMAKIMEKDKEALRLAKEIIVMGGAANINGNCSPVAEYNFWVDPDAAKIFFQEDLENVTLVPLDVTFKTVFSPAMREMIHQFHTKLGDYVNAITRFYVDFHWKQERTLGCVINDPLVVAYLMNRELCTLEKAYVDVETQGIALGQSVCDFELRGVKKNAVNVCTRVNTDLFFDIFLKTIFSEHADDISLMVKKGYLNK